MAARRVDGTTIEMIQVKSKGIVLFTGDELHQKVQCISRPMKGFGTAGCRREDMADELKANNSFISADFAAHFDISSAAMLVARGYHPVRGIKKRESYQ